MNYIIAAATDKGQYRKSNQDSILTCKKEINGETIVLGVLCDGMGGLAYGDVASHLAIKLFDEWFERFTFDKSNVSSVERVLKEWNALISDINLQIYNYSSSLPTKVKMGTTLSAILLLKGCYVIGHVGDSRVYVANQNRILQLTEDHSLLATEIREGRITLAESRYDSRKHLLIRSVGVKDEINPQLLSGKIYANDSFLLCSDGLWNKIEDFEIQQEAISQDPGVERLIGMARNRNEKDNISVIKITQINENSYFRTKRGLLVAGAIAIFVGVIIVMLRICVNWF